jgi:hypothetical protein
MTANGGMLVRQEINLNAERRRPEALTGGRGRRKIFRERGWWQSGLDKLASYRPLNKLEGWVSIGQTLDAKLLSALTVALQSTAPNHPPFLEDSTLARLFRNGTEMGLLGLHSSAHDIYATHGSLEGGRMRAGVHIVRDNSNDPPLSPQDFGLVREAKRAGVLSEIPPMVRVGPVLKETQKPA